MPTDKKAEEKGETPFCNTPLASVYDRQRAHFSPIVSLKRAVSDVLAGVSGAIKCVLGPELNPPGEISLGVFNEQ